MYHRVKKGFAHTVVYGLGNVGARLVGFILLPLYTRYLTVAEYGIFGILETTLLIGVEILDLGLKHSLIRLYPEHDTAGRRRLFFTLFFFILGIGLAWGGIAWFTAPWIAGWSHDPAQFTGYLRFLAAVLFLRILNNYILSWFRGEERPHRYVGMNLVRFGLILATNIYFVAFTHAGITGIMKGLLLAEVGLLLLLVPDLLRSFHAGFDGALLSRAIRFGFPLVLSSLTSMFLMMGNRYLLKLLTNYHTVGLFTVGHKIGSLFNTLLLQSFGLGLLPLFYSAYGQEGDRRYYRKMMTYFSFVLVWSGLALSLFGDESVALLARSRDYRPAAGLVPIIVLAYVFRGGHQFVSLGLYLKEKTGLLAWSNALVLFLYVFLNMVLIPAWGMFGAAWAMTGSYLVLYGITYVLAEAHYPIGYENSRLLKMLLVAGGLYGVSMGFRGAEGANILWKLLLTAAFPLVLFGLRFYEPAEMHRLCRLPKDGFCRLFGRTEKVSREKT